MTSDAKIGLLLGLVFIFIIAFIINGLPHPWSHSSVATAPAATKPNELGGLAGSAQEAQKKLPDFQPSMLDTTGSATATTPAGAGTSQEPLVAKGDTGAGQTPAVLDPLSVAVDSGLQKAIDSLKTGNGSSQTPPTSDALVGAIVATEKTSSLTPAPETKVTQTQVAVKLPAKTEKATTEKTSSPAPTSANAKQAVKEYVVQAGDDLGTIAKKVYGSVAGNVDRIYEYNKGTLKSKDVVTVGQKLRIPPLPASSSSSPKPEDVLPASQFTKVPSVGNAALVDTKGGAAPSLKPAVNMSGSSGTDARLYVVQADDNLWKIAASQLGSGARYEEIVKLNAAVLRSKDNLSPGMRLKMPAK